jgi:hypothetical protein
MEPAKDGGIWGGREIDMREINEPPAIPAARLEPGRAKTRATRSPSFWPSDPARAQA